MKIGFLVNPVAGLGGKLGFKGTDGKDILEKVKALKAEPIATKRAIEALMELKRNLDYFELITYPYEMGFYEAKEVGIEAKVVGQIKDRFNTTAEDTKRAVREFLKLKVDLILFAGGDGTARDLILAGVKGEPCLGIPAGVKIYSSCFAFNPREAGLLASKFLKGEVSCSDAEVLDIDEQAYRDGRLKVRLFGYLKTPYHEEAIQPSKSFTLLDEDELSNLEAIAKYVIENMEEDTIYILSAGNTVKVIADKLGIDKTPLGVDLILKKKLIERDANEEIILNKIRGKKAKIIVSPLGNQGFIFGRGNQQISDKVIKQVGKENIIVIASHRKLSKLKELRVDTGNSNLDEKLKGHIRVITDYNYEEVKPLV
ncbi:MAG: ATP-NAD kinase family protein [Nitrososphaerales archaeon]